MKVAVAVASAMLIGVALNAHAGTLTTLYAFKGGADGASPVSGVISKAGLLYGTTIDGGGMGCQNQTGCGTLFSVVPSSGLETILATFPGKGAVGDRGGIPIGTPLFFGGKFFGARFPTKKAMSGAIYEVPLRGGKVKSLYSFDGEPDAAEPDSTPVLSNGLLIGTSIFGGANGLGAIYTVDPSTRAEKVIYSFSGLDGAEPASPVTVDGTTLYGITSRGGANGVSSAGAIYQLDTATGVETVLYSFGDLNGYSNTPLLQSGSALYGTVVAKKKGGGWLFEYNLATATFTILHKFAGKADGSQASGPLMLLGKTLYGTTCGGGSAGQGTIFSYNLANNTESVLYSFSGMADGGVPAGSGVIDVGGIFYGTTYFGGASNMGTVFSFSP